jgi:TatA/E family protein of Tat protein translocase
MGSRGFSEFVVIGAIILVVFGGKYLPRVARALGTAFRNFKTSRRDGDRR